MSIKIQEELLQRCYDLEQQLEAYKGTRKQLQQSQRQLTRLFNNLPGMAYRCSVDSELNTILEFVSKGCVELCGVSPEYFTDQKTNVLDTLTHPDDLSNIRKLQDAAILGNHPYKLLYRIFLEDGRLKWIWDQGECVYDDDGTPLYLEGIMIDISAQKLREFELLQENQRLQEGALEDRYKFKNIIGKSRGMREVFKLIVKAAKSNANVIILGETGTGKDLVAQTIHEERGTGGPYVPVNCGAIPANLMESEFFGHKKGSFTGAGSDRQGYLAAADGGTLFLDEVGEIDLSIQVKLLRALESKLYTPVGRSHPMYSNFRLIAATNRDLGEMVKNGTMRSDFFFRLHVLPIRVPPLRERLEDLPLLASEFMARYLGEDTTPPKLPGNLRAVFDTHNWPGNVRELQNVLERYLTFGDMVMNDFGLDASDMNKDLDESLIEAENHSSLEKAMSYLERRIILKTLEKNHWRKGKTAGELGLNMRTMQRKLKKHGL
jgi:PAS domain S-box-containing protein